MMSFVEDGKEKSMMSDGRGLTLEATVILVFIESSA